MALPFTIENQPNQDELCYDITEDMELEFTFLPCKKRNVDLIWRWDDFCACQPKNRRSA